MRATTLLLETATIFVLLYEHNKYIHNTQYMEGNKANDCVVEERCEKRLNVIKGTRNK